MIMVYGMACLAKNWLSTANSCEVGQVLAQKLLVNLNRIAPLFFNDFNINMRRNTMSVLVMTADN